MKTVCSQDGFDLDLFLGLRKTEHLCSVQQEKRKIILIRTFATYYGKNSARTLNHLPEK